MTQKVGNSLYIGTIGEEVDSKRVSAAMEYDRLCKEKRDSEDKT